MPVFLFTDIEGSTRHWTQHKRAMADVIKQHNSLLRETIIRHQGQIIEFTGDGVYAVFEGGRPLAAAIEIQRRVATHNWGPVEDFRLRIGLNAVTPDREGFEYFHEGEKYFGLAVNHAFRIMSAGAGGQILLTPIVLNYDELPADIRVEDLGLHMLKSLSQPQRIMSLIDPSLPWKPFPPLNTLSTRPNNLPTQTTPFVARSHETAESIRLLAQENCRLLTLTGPGGVGKTRLAIQIAAELINDFRDGVFFIPLEPVLSPTFMVSNIAANINFSFQSSENQKFQLLNYLRTKNMLLVMDNFEHLLEGVGIVADILENAPQVKILTTSRDRLNFTGERSLSVEGLMVPRSLTKKDFETYGIIQLFLNIVRRTQPDFELEDNQIPAVIRICNLVAGMPLGVELAASWVRIYSCNEVANRLEQNLRFLVSRRPDIPERHRGLYAVCDYFWEQLSEPEQSVIRKLSVFRGGFHAQAAWEVANASTFFLSALMDRAFLQKVRITTATQEDQSNQPEAWQVRYEMHAVLRQYAAEKLTNHQTEHQITFEHHSRYYASFLNQRTERLKGKQQQATLDQIISEIDNIRQAWNWAVKNADYEIVQKALSGLDQAYFLANWVDDGISAFKDATETLGQDPNIDKALIGNLLLRQARFISQTTQINKAILMVEEAINILSNNISENETAYAYQIYAHVARIKGDLDSALRYHEKCLGIFRENGNNYEVARTVSRMSDCLYRKGDFEKARNSFWDSYNMYRRIGDPRGMAFTLTGLGILLNQLGEPENAKTLLHECLSLYRSINDRSGLAISFHNLGSIALGRQDYQTAKVYFEEGLTLFQEMSNQYTLAAAMSGLGVVSYKLGKVADAKKHLLSAINISKDLGLRPILHECVIQTAEIAMDEGNAELAAEILAFCLAQPGLDKAETEGHAIKVLESVEDRLSFDQLEAARQRGRQKELSSVIANAIAILSKQGELYYDDSDRFSYRISQRS